ncbi:c-type cytochrome [Steroidobacter sp. S1-65]|uniref:C-type cytochrome n=1 Tax=Steroidobacter gossypii TaxID=2805490 RepID=A0ABS1WT20_9GAMM|nr:c-type cytochrome [Steroidobacter gossypii]MBM0104105.1 c-type cytochrome [Steroidobacter gossypii]
MNKLIKIVGGTLVVLAAGIGVTVGAAMVLSERKLNRVVDVKVGAIDLASYTPNMQRGEYLFLTRGCSECHGAKGEGRLVIDDSSSGFYVYTPNITRGGSGAAATYTDTDWIALLRHGLKPARTPVFIMPSEDYAQMADEDVAALVAYIRALPPAPERKAEMRIPLMLKALYAFGVTTDASEKIDHTKPAPARVPSDLHSQGEYIARTCAGCHGAGLAGGKIPGAPPSWPAAANLTSAPDGVMTRYTSPEQFREMMRSGRRADGTPVAVMPFESLRAMSDAELDAVFGFLKTLQPKASGTR